MRGHQNNMERGIGSAMKTKEIVGLKGDDSKIYYGTESFLFIEGAIRKDRPFFTIYLVSYTPLTSGFG